MIVDVLRRAWDALDSFKQAYPENWDEDDEQVLNDLMRADLTAIKQALEQPEHEPVVWGPRREWVELTDDEWQTLWDGVVKYAPSDLRLKDFARAIESKLREKNNG